MSRRGEITHCLPMLTRIRRDSSKVERSEEQILSGYIQVKIFQLVILSLHLESQSDGRRIQTSSFPLRAHGLNLMHI